MTRAVALLLAAVGVLCGTQPVKAAPLFKRGDPRITTYLFVYRPYLVLLDRKVGVYPFDVVQQGEPVPPAFAPLLAQALLQEGSAVSVTQVPIAPWEQTPIWEAPQWSEAGRIAAVLADGRERGFDYVVLGRIDRFYRTAAQGLMARVTVWLISTQDGAVVWYGAKHAEWLRRYPLEECLLNLAWSFAIDWRPPLPP